MFVLVSSNAERLFQRNILGVLAYPDSHSFTFRYQTKYVSPRVVDAVKDQSTTAFQLFGRKALIVYAERPSESSGPYHYCPVRFADLLSLRLLGDVIYVEMSLSVFPDLSDWEKTAEHRMRFTQAICSRPGTLEGKGGKGAFLDILEPDGWKLWPKAGPEGWAWQSVVDRLAAMRSMEKCVFYRVRGFFQPVHRRVFSDSPPEKTIPLRAQGSVLVFDMPMSKPIDLKVLFYRPHFASPKTIRADVEIAADNSGFSDVPTKRLTLESRYDELTFRMSSKRVLDNTMAPVSIKVTAKDSQEDILASDVLLICNVRVPPSLLIVLVSLFFVAPILISLTADDVNCVKAVLAPGLVDGTQAADVACDWSKRLAAVFKVIGGMAAAAAGYIVFRRFPVGK
jgi:hypothetical protein